MKKIALIMTMALVLCGALAMSAQAFITNPFNPDVPLNNLLADGDFSENTFAAVVDNSLSTGWLPDGIGKHIDLRVFFEPGQDFYVETFLWVYLTNPETAPLPPTVDSDPNWVFLRAAQGYTKLADEFSLDVQLTFQPRWEYVAFEAFPQIDDGEILTSLVDGVDGHFIYTLDLETYCKPVPVPPTAILLGSGLLGLVGFRLRRKLS